jgi:hypothetical protein
MLTLTAMQAGCNQDTGPRSSLEASTDADRRGADCALLSWTTAAAGTWDTENGSVARRKPEDSIPAWCPAVPAGRIGRCRSPNSPRFHRTERSWSLGCCTCGRTARSQMLPGGCSRARTVARRDGLRCAALGSASTAPARRGSTPISGRRTGSAFTSSTGLRGIAPPPSTSVPPRRRPPRSGPTTSRPRCGEVETSSRKSAASTATSRRRP